MSLTQSGPRWDDTIIAGHRPPGAAIRGRLAILARAPPGSRGVSAGRSGAAAGRAPGAVAGRSRPAMEARRSACPIEWYRDRYPELDGESLVALLYEEYCLREEAGESPEAAEYQARFPDVADSFREVLEIHDLIGRAQRTRARAGPAATVRRSRRPARRSPGSGWSRSWAEAHSRGSISPRSSIWPTGPSR